MKIPKHLLEPLKNPFSEAKRKELTAAWTKMMVNDALKQRKAAEQAKQEIKGEKKPDSV